LNTSTLRMLRKSKILTYRKYRNLSQFYEQIAISVINYYANGLGDAKVEV